MLRPRVACGRNVAFSSIAAIAKAKPPCSNCDSPLLRRVCGGVAARGIAHRGGAGRPASRAVAQPRYRYACRPSPGQSRVRHCSESHEWRDLSRSFMATPCLVTPALALKPPALCFPRGSPGRSDWRRTPCRRESRMRSRCPSGRRSVRTAKATPSSTATARRRRS